MTTQTLPDAPPVRARVGHESGFWLVGFAYIVVMAAGGAPTPLYVLYQRRDHFGAAMLTVIFAAYAVGVLVSLLLAGHVSDHIGRRRVLVPAVALQFVSALVFLAWPGLAGLLVARVVSGLSVGVMTSTATAHMLELHTGARPGASGRRAELTTTAANLGGVALGPLIVGALAQWAPSPLRLPYIVLAVLLALAGLAVAVAPETRPVSSAGWAYRPQRIAVPVLDRSRYLAAALGAVVAFAVLGLFFAMAPSFLAGTLHQHSHALAGAVAFASLAAGAVAQILIARVAPRRIVVGAVAALPIGLTLVVAGVWTPSLLLFVVGGIVSGAGSGSLFKGSLATVLTLSTPATRAGLLTGLFVACYTGLAGPAVGLGVAAQYADPRAALSCFAALVVAGVAGAGRVLLATPRRAE
jgi:MFS family permease